MGTFKFSAYIMRGVTLQSLDFQSTTHLTLTQVGPESQAHMVLQDSHDLTTQVEKPDDYVCCKISLMWSS